MLTTMNLPSDFSQRTHELLGDNDYRQLEDALQDEAPVSIRVNSAKCDREVKGERVPWSANGIYLAERPTFTFDPLFHAGVYYVQEASSMFLSQVVEQHFSGADTVLDLCAAPGGKATALGAALNDTGFLLANDISTSRARARNTPMNTSTHGSFASMIPSTIIFIRVACGAGISAEPKPHALFNRDITPDKYIFLTIGYESFSLF